MAVGTHDILAAMRRVEIIIRDFEQRAADNEHAADSAFQKAWDNAVQQWWELAEAVDAIGSKPQDASLVIIQQFVEEVSLRGDVLT